MVGICKLLMSPSDKKCSEIKFNTIIIKLQDVIITLYTVYSI